ncbi:MAG: hypothetical protein AAFV07_02645, partial [Bacteroidota bacterium]
RLLHSFKSTYYPKSRNNLQISQEFAMQYYGAFNIVIMLGVMVHIVGNGVGMKLVGWVIAAEAIALILGNLFAYAQMRKSFAQIFFVNEHFSLISIYDILNDEPHTAFPLRLASPQISADQNRLSLHFNDQVITLKREDWEDFDLIRDWLFSRQL